MTTKLGFDAGWDAARECAAAAIRTRINTTDDADERLHLVRCAQWVEEALHCVPERTAKRKPRVKR